MSVSQYRALISRRRDDRLDSARKPRLPPATELAFPSLLGGVENPVKTLRDWFMTTWLP